MDRKLSIAYFPFENKNNRYTDNFKKILSSFGDIAEAPPLKNILRQFRFHRFDVLILNWSDNNFVDAETGAISPFGVAKEFFRIAVYKLIACKLVFVRHNVYPHEAAGENRARAKKLVEWYEKCFDLCWVHSGHMVEDRRLYVPHPLYEVASATELTDEASKTRSRFSLPEKYFIVFGRIQSYKQIDLLIEHLPDDMHLLVCGSCADHAYKQKLIAYRKPNVTIIAEFISDELATKLILASCGVVICHADDDMIVSGSIVFAISLGVPVLAIATPFVRWFHDTINARMIVAANDFDDLIDKMRVHQSAITASDVAVSQQHFCDQAVISHVASTFDRLDLVWRR
jgi:glycosyltransferase involved in cell wall biosynthesis